MSKELTTDTPSDVLNSHVENYTNIPHEDKTVYDHSFMENIAEHANTPKESISKLYNHIAPKVGEYETNLIVNSMLNNPNTPSDVVNHIAMNDTAYRSKGASVHPNVDTRVLEDRANKYINETYGSKPPVKNLTPEFYENLLNNRKNHTEDEPNAKTDNEDEIVRLGYATTKHHTPDSIERGVKIFEKGPIYGFNAPTNPSSTIDSDDLVSDFIGNNDLSKDQLNRLHSVYESSSEDYPNTISSIVSHKNADPTLLGKIVKTYNSEESDHNKKGLFRSALGHSNLPNEVLSSVVEKPELDWHEKEALNLNENLSPDQIDKLVSNGHKEFLGHKNTNPDSIKKAWDLSSKDSDAAKEMLGYKNLPPEVLKEIVNHKSKNIAIRALQHKNVNKDVVDTALKRKALDVYEAAKQHPLAGHDIYTNEFKQGKRNLHDMWKDSKAMEAWDKMSPEDKHLSLRTMHEKLKGTDLEEISKKSKQSLSDVVQNKLDLIKSPELSQDERDSNTDDLLQMFSESHPKNMSIYSGNDPRSGYYSSQEHKLDLKQSVKDLISNGNKKAEDFALQHPGLTKDLLDSKSRASTSFLDKLYDADKANKENNTQIYDQYGMPDKYSSDAWKLIHNDYSSMDTVKKIVKDYPGVLDTHDWGSKNNEDQTWLSDKFEDMSDSEKEKNINDLLEISNGGAAPLIIATKNTPEKVKNELWDKLTPPEKHDLVTGGKYYFNPHDLNNHEENKKILSGHYNDLLPENMKPRHILGNLEKSVISGMSPSNKSHVSILKDTIKNSEDSKSDNIISSLSQDFKKHKDFLNIIPEDKVESIGTTAAIEHLIANEHSGADKLQGVVSNLKDFIKSHADKIENPQEKQDYITKTWKDILYGRTSTRVANKAGKVFDDLVDSSGSEQGNELNRILLKDGLLSEEKKAELESKKSFTERLDSIEHSKKMDYILNSVKGKSLSQPDFEAAVNQFQPDVYLYNHKFNNDHEEVSNDMLNFFDHVADDDKVFYISKLFDTDLDSNTKKILPNLINPLFEKINNLQNWSNEGLNALKDSFFKKVYESLGPVKQVKDLAKKMVDNTISNKNGDLLYNMIDKKILPSTYNKHLINMLQTSPESFGSGTLLSGATSLGYDDSNQKLAETFVNALDKEAQKSIDQHKDYSKQKNLFTRLSQAHTQDQSKLQSITNFLKKHTFSEDPVTSEDANKSLAKMLYSNLPKEEKTSIFKSLPNTPEIASSIEYGNLDTNNPDVLENITGHKLKKFLSDSDSFGKLTKQNIDVVTNRLFLDNEITEGDRIIAFSDLSTNPVVSPESIAKLGRSIPHNVYSAQVGTIFSLSKSGSSEHKLNSLSTALHQLVESKIDELDKLMVPQDEGSPYFGSEYLSEAHLSEIKKHLTPLAKFVGGTFFDESSTDVKSKLQTYSKVYESLDKHLGTILKNSKPEDVKKNAEIASEVLRDVTYSSLDISNEDLNHISNIISMSKQGGYDISLSHPIDIRDYKKLINRAKDAQLSDWQIHFEKHPELNFCLDGVQELNSNVLGAYSFEKAYEADPQSAVHSAVKMIGRMDDNTLDKYGKSILSKVVNAFTDPDVTPPDLSVPFKALGDKVSYSEFQDLVQDLDHAQKYNTQAIALQYGVGGQDLADSYVKERGVDEIYASSLFIDKKHSNEIVNNWEKDLKSTEIVDKLLRNYRTDVSSLDKISNILIENHKSGYNNLNKQESSSLAMVLLKHPNLSKESIERLYEETSNDKQVVFLPSKQYHPAFANPTWGGYLMRKFAPALPSEFKKTINEEKLVKSVSVHDKDVDVLQNTMNKIPVDGIMWADFKKMNPELENNKVIKNIFMSKNNKPVVPEDFANAMQSAEIQDKAKEYHMTYSIFDLKLQQHANKPSLVFQLNNSEKSEKEMSQDPKLWSLYQMVLKETNGIRESSIGLHPTTPQMVAWSRVDTSSNEKGWIIEEFQSDFAQKFRKNIRTILANSPNGLEIDGHKLSPKEIKDYIKKIDAQLGEWSKAGMNTVIENAKAQGVKTLYMHGAGIRSHMSGGSMVNGKLREYNKDFINPRISEIYDGTAQKYGFTKVDYTDYPHKSVDTLNETRKKGLPTHCWALSLTNEPISEKPVKAKKTRKPKL